MFDQDPDQNLGFLLHDVSRLLRKRFDRRARALGITRAQWRVLVHLAPRQGINQSALADILELDNVTLGQHVDRLEATGWLERRPDPGDRRVRRLFLTEAVKPVLDRMEALAVQTQAEAFAGLESGMREELRTRLLAIKGNLLEPPADDATPGDGNGTGNGDDRVADLRSARERRRAARA